MKLILNEGCTSLSRSTVHLIFPVTTQQKRTCKIMQESCMQDLHAICPFSCTILHQFLQDLAKKVQETPNLQVIILAASLAKSCTISCKNHARLCKNRARIVQDCARKGTGISGASLACKILARFLQDSCKILQVHFCWEVP